MEFGPKKRPAVSGGARRQWRCVTAAIEGGRRRQTEGRLGRRGGVQTSFCWSERGGRGHVARGRPPRGRHQVEQGGRVRRRGQQRAGLPLRLAEKGGESTHAGSSFSLFLISFSNKYLNIFLSCYKSFSDVARKTKVAQNKILYNLL